MQQWSPFAATIGTDAASGPSGAGSAADKLTENSATSAHAIVQDNVAIAADTPFVLSVFAKPAGRSWLKVRMQRLNGQSVEAWFNVDNGTVGTATGCTAEIVPAGNGYYRVSIAAASTLSGSFAAQAWFQLATGNAVNSYAGDGASGVYLWGAQLEPGVSVPGAYVITTAAQVQPAANALNAVLGFTDDNQPLATSVTGAYQIRNLWCAPDPVTGDTGDLDQFERAQTVALSGVVKSVEYGDPDAPKRIRTVSFAFLPAYKVFIADEGSNTNEAIQRLFRRGWTRFRWFNDQADLATGTDYVLDLDTAKALPHNRLSHGAALFSLSLRMRPLV
jgi:hypothetical protein